MKYFPPTPLVKEWKLKKWMLPNEVDQPEVDRENVAALLTHFYKIVQENEFFMSVFMQSLSGVWPLVTESEMTACT